MLPEDDLRFETCSSVLNVLMFILEFIIIYKVHLLVFMIKKLQNVRYNDKEICIELSSSLLVPIRSLLMLSSNFLLHLLRVNFHEFATQNIPHISKFSHLIYTPV
jgi:hypothetical protein